MLLMVFVVLVMFLAEDGCGLEGDTRRLDGGASQGQGNQPDQSECKKNFIGLQVNLL